MINLINKKEIRDEYACTHDTGMFSVQHAGQKYLLPIIHDADCKKKKYLWTITKLKMHICM